MNIDVVLSVAGVVLLLGLLGYIGIRPAAVAAASGQPPTWRRERVIEICRIMIFCALLTLLFASGGKVLVH